MARSMKRDKNALYAHEHEGGHDPVIRKVRDGDVQHSKDCYLCQAGTKPKRLLRIKPRRRKEQAETRALAREALG